MTHREIWDKYCQSHKVVQNAVPLFATDNLIVKTKEIGIASKRSILLRSSAMEQMIVRETDKLITDWSKGTNIYDGLIYMMMLLDEGRVIPLYIGKAETIGKGNGNLSANIKRLSKDFTKFARWGDNYAYHIGDLSAAVLPSHASDKINRKYIDWGNALFENAPSATPKLRQEVFFWATAWDRNAIGPWHDFGPTRLTFLEYLLIGVASSAFPETLLNREGQNRGVL